MNFSKDHNLFCVILKDLFKNEYISLVLLLCNLLCACFTIWNTNNARNLIHQQEFLMKEHHNLEVEWRNLVLEVNVLNQPLRIKNLAKQELKMHIVKQGEERILYLSQDHEKDVN